jgi:hypothetical protein
MNFLTFAQPTSVVKKNKKLCETSWFKKGRVIDREQRYAKYFFKQGNRVPKVPNFLSIFVDFCRKEIPPKVPKVHNMKIIINSQLNITFAAINGKKMSTEQIKLEISDNPKLLAIEEVL